MWPSIYMAYSSNPEDDLVRKEFAITQTASSRTDKFTEATKKIRWLNSYQVFIKHLMNPHTANTRLLVEYGTGSGKTRIGLETIVQYLNMSTIAISDPTASIPGAALISFNKDIWRNTLISQTSLGYVSEQEIAKLAKLGELRAMSSEHMENYNAFRNSLLRRISADPRRRFRFIGYKKLRNELYSKNAAGVEVTNEAYLHTFDNSIIVCDEIQTVWNADGLNEWGIALVNILSNAKNIRGMFLTATPFNTSANEITSIIDILGGDSKGILPPLNNLAKIAKELHGKVVHLSEQSINFPERIFMGESVAEIPYLKFIRYTLSDEHARVLLGIIKGTADGKNAGPFIADAYFGDNVTDIHQIPASSMVTVVDDIVPIITGSFLKHKNIGQYSRKYLKILDLLAGIADAKIMIYHNLVHGTGVLMLGQMLRENGYIGERDVPTDTSICYQCNVCRADHTATHMYYPARYTLYHSDIRPDVRAYSFAEFSRSQNKDGHLIKILVGGPAISEGLDFTAIQHLIVASTPTGISDLIQLMGRAARFEGHADLPTEKRVARFYLLADNIGYDLQKYRTKMSLYEEIQKIDRVLHEVALDGTYVNDYNTGTRHPIQSLAFQPLVPKGTPSHTTFDIYFKNYEIQTMVSMIKRLLMHNPVWDLDTLYEAIKNPPFDTKVDTRLFDKDYLRIALYIVVSTEYLFTMSTTAYNQLSCIIDATSSNVFDNIPYVIRHIGKYIVRVPILHGHTTYTQPNTPYQRVSPPKILTINVRSAISRIANRTTYEDKRALFYKKYSLVPFGKMKGVLTEYDAAFHIHLVEDCVKYVHDVLVGTAAVGEFHDFMFKMLYFYNNLHLIIFANGVKSALRYMWTNIAFDVTSKANPRIECLKTTLSTTECSWLPNTRAEVYRTAMVQSSEFLENRATLVPANLVPVGHSIRANTALYDGVWHELSESIFEPTAMVENDDIIGYHVRSQNDIGVKFKLRPPAHKLTVSEDIRKIERGINCVSKPKRDLARLCKQLGIDVQKTNTNSCVDIEARLIWLELNERNKGTNVKYFYLVFEERAV